MTSALPAIIRVSDLAAVGLDDRELRRARARGELVTVAPGAFVTTESWHRLTRHQKYALQVHARMARLSSRLVASHDSAAVLWGMPCLDRWPGAVHVIDDRLDKPTRKGTLVRHTGPLNYDEVTVSADLRATDGLRTAVDMALRDGFITALMLFDFGLRHEMFTIEEATKRLERHENARRIRAVLRALDFASPLSDSPGESISRAQIILLGFEPPELQRKFYEGGREVARVDFFWENVGVVGEFDGDEKYVNPTMRAGRSVDQVVLDEKWRSESLLDRPEVSRVVRWNYAMARNPEQLTERLLRAGVPRLSPRRNPRP